MDEMGMNIFIRAALPLLAPVGGGLLAGLDRKLAARMQRRVGPPVVQPFYDVLKLFEKERIAVNEAQGFYLAGFLFFMILSGIFFLRRAISFLSFSLSLWRASASRWRPFHHRHPAARWGQNGNFFRLWRMNPCFSLWRLLSI